MLKSKWTLFSTALLIAGTLLALGALPVEASNGHHRHHKQQAVQCSLPVPGHFTPAICFAIP